ncbi:MAG: OsmC family protein [Chloroflexia bacterium]
MAAPAADLREFDVSAGSTETPGRVMCSVRNHHIIIDGPVQNGFPGEEITPAELFLSAVASCGVELVQMLAIQNDISLEAINVKIHGLLDRGNPARTDYTVFNTVQVECRLRGVSQEQAEQLVEGFTRRCPLFGSVAVATPDLQVRIVSDET